MENHTEQEISKKLHDLRTPLNQIIGFCEMLAEIAEEDGHRDLVENFSVAREAGAELADLLQDKRLISTEAHPGRDYWPLNEAVREPSERITHFTDNSLAATADPRLALYRDDIIKVRTAADHFLDLANTCGLLIHLESRRRWEAVNSFPAAPSISVLPPPGTGGGRILIVDDENLNREVLNRRLQREGYESTEVGSGREALKLLEKEEFDVVLLDILMPGMSGMDVLQTLKKDPELRHLPVIMLSGLTDVEGVARCIELGADDYLPKPINATLLRARLSACLEKKHLRDQEQAHMKALHAEKERVSVTLRSLADAVVTTDANGRIVLLNDVGARLTGTAGEAATGIPFEDVFRVYCRATGRPAANIVQAALQQNEVVESEPGLAIMPPDGIERLVSMRSAPIHDSEGAINGIVVVVRDITEKEKMAEELLRASKLQSIGVLAGGLAHDFNNMLTAVMGNLSLIRQLPNMSPEVLCSLSEAENGATRAQELTRYLLTFAEGGAPMKQVLQARALIQETSAFVLRGSNVHCEFDLPDNLWQTEADPNQLAQVVSNIVLNAVQATPNGGKIFVRAKNINGRIRSAPNLPAGDYLSVSVEDRGTGISPEHLPRIYDPFFTTKKQARGLGLAAAYSIIQRHGGQITVESTPGAGATVTFHLPALRPVAMPPAPIVQTPETPAVQPPPGEQEASARKHRVLIMDDDDAIRMLTKIMFMRMGYDVETTADGEAALAAHAEAAAEGRPFDLVVMDLTIPGGMGGKETIRRLREKDQDVRAIVSSGYSNDPVMAHFLEHGFNGVLPKPYTSEHLTSVVKQLVPR